MDVFKANVRIRSTAKALAILAFHRREKYFVLEQYQSATFAKSTVVTRSWSATFHRKSEKKPGTSREKSCEKCYEEKSRKNENAGIKDRTGTKLQRRFKIESVI